MSADEAPTDISALLDAWSQGDLGARNRVLPLVYEELRRQARAQLRREPAGHLLQATALVHEAYLRLTRQDRVVWQNRAHFYGVAAQMMRRILVDHARARNAGKRSGQRRRLALSDVVIERQPIQLDVLDLDAALAELASFDHRKSQVAELRYFAGLSLEETGALLGVSLATVEREWQAARAWLFQRLKGRRHDP